MEPRSSIDGQFYSADGERHVDDTPQEAHCSMYYSIITYVFLVLLNEIIQNKAFPLRFGVTL